MAGHPADRLGRSRWRGRGGPRKLWLPGVLIGRSAELAALEDFTGSGTRWRWIQGDAFAGKTALLAWFALHPPERR